MNKWSCDKKSLNENCLFVEAFTKATGNKHLKVAFVNNETRKLFEACYTLFSWKQRLDEAKGNNPLI